MEYLEKSLVFVVPIVIVIAIIFKGSARQSNSCNWT